MKHWKRRALYLLINTAAILAVAVAVVPRPATSLVDEGTSLLQGMEVAVSNLKA